MQLDLKLVLILKHKANPEKEENALEEKLRMAVEVRALTGFTASLWHSIALKTWKGISPLVPLLLHLKKK